MRNVYRFVLVLILIAALIIGQAVPVFSASADDYKDITGNWAEPQIIDLINLGIIDGYEDNTIRPDNNITRAEFANILLKAMNIKADVSTSVIYFRDVKPGDWYYAPITTLKQLSIIDGYGDKTFKPGRNISRAEMIAMLVRISKGKLYLNNNLRVYKDVPISHWAYRDISVATKAGIIANQSSLFYPNEFVTRAEVAYSIDKLLWNQRNDGIIDNQALIDFTTRYNTLLNLKYNTNEIDMSDLRGMSYGGQLETLDFLTQRNSMYRNLGVRFERTVNIFNPTLLGVSYDLARVRFEYDLISKMLLGGNTSTITRNGFLTYSLKRVQDNWFIYDYLEATKDEAQPIGKLNMVWDYVGYPVDSFKLGVVDGLDVISPTWFNVSDSGDSVESRASKKYVEWAHKNGYEVWALFSNQFSPQLTSQVLRSSVKKEKIINKIVEYVDLYDIDGINIDFENMYKADKDLFTQFVQELSRPLKSRGVIVSVDVTVKAANSNWSECYDRGALAKIVDYIAVMTYDQHWSTSRVSGSVAQLNWVENGIKGLLNEVPKEKLLLGLPFYTREWKETPSPNGVIVTSEALSMTEAANRIAANGAKKVWDDESGQYYAEYSKNGSKYRIWLEDERSINLKSQLANKYDLGGVASWRAGLETKGVWEVIRKNLN